MNVLTTEIKKTDKELTNDEYLAKYFPGMSAFDVHHKFRGRICNMGTAKLRLKQILQEAQQIPTRNHEYLRCLTEDEYSQVLNLLEIMVKSDE